MGAVMMFALGVGFGANTSVVLAAAVSVLLVFLPPVVTLLRNDPKPWQHYSGVVMDYLTPPGYASHYQGIAWADPPAAANLHARRQFQRPVVDYVEVRKPC